MLAEETIMPSEPTEPRPDVHHGRLCWITRWYGDPDPDTGKRPRYAERWYVDRQQDATRLYQAWLTRWHDDPRIRDPKRQAEALTVAALAQAYLRHCETLYRKNGKLTSYIYNVRSALQSLIDHHGDLMAADLTPPMLAKWRDAQVIRPNGAPRARDTVNKWLHIIWSCYQWAVERGDIDATVMAGLRAVKRLQKGRTAAVEAGKVKPVAWATVEQTINHCAPAVEALIRVLWHTGMRPDEACMMRGCDLEQGGEVWLYRPESHKLDHMEGERERVVAIGPRAQEIITPFLVPDLSAYLFRPPVNRCDAGERYTTPALRQAIHRACDEAFPPPEELRRKRVEAGGRKKSRWETDAEWRGRIGRKSWRKVMEWRAANHWNPNQLRHARATELRKSYGLEHARVILGHSKTHTTEIYAERDLASAKEAAMASG